MDSQIEHAPNNKLSKLNENWTCSRYMRIPSRFSATPRVLVCFKVEIGDFWEKKRGVSRGGRREMTFQKADIRSKEIPVTSMFLNFVKKKKLLSWFNISYQQVVQNWLSHA